MKIETFLKQLAQEWELQNGFLSEAPGIWKIPLDEGETITVTDLGSSFRMDCRVIDAPRGKEEDLYTQMLLANLFGQGTYGSVISLDDEARHIELSRTIDYDINFKDFKDILEDFINAVDFWREEALNYQQ